MADSSPLSITWDANTEPDLSWYRAYYTMIPLTYAAFSQITAPTVTKLFSMSDFASDGLWYFTVSAGDTSNNESPKVTPAISRRIVRTASKLIVRR